jgi:hypothetical protein
MKIADILTVLAFMPAVYYGAQGMFVPAVIFINLGIGIQIISATSENTALLKRLADKHG